MISLLGSTGTIGVKTLSLLSNTDLKIFALTAHTNKKLLANQIIKYNPSYAVIKSKNDAEYLKQLCDKKKINTKILSGESFQTNKLRNFLLLDNHNNLGDYLLKSLHYNYLYIENILQTSSPGLPISSPTS